jgi:hypothetical protein
MIVGHRTLPDLSRTIVFRVAFPVSSENFVDTYEMTYAEVEAAILAHKMFERTCRKTVEEWDSDAEG